MARYFSKRATKGRPELRGDNGSPDRTDSGEDDDDSTGTVVDVKLFKAIGLYQLLCPAYGRSGRRYRAALLTILRIAFALQVTQLLGLYYAVNDLQRFTNMAVLVVCGMLCVFKGYVVITQGERMWAVLDAARYGFASPPRRGRRRQLAALRRCRTTLSVLLRGFVAFSYATLAVWLAVPFLMDAHVPVADVSGTVDRYRLNINNLWVPVPGSVYNAPAVWTMFYAVEAFLIVVNVFCWALFDCFMITACFVLNVQFRNVSAMYRTLGRHRSRTASLRSSGPCESRAQGWTQ